MANPYEGIAARLNFSKPGRSACKAWPKQKLEDGQSVGEILESLKERPAFQVAARSDWFVELQGVVAASDSDSIAAQVAALAAAAAARGAHAEWARFPLEGNAFLCQVWDGKRKKFVEAEPEASHVQADYRFIQKGLREEAKKLAPTPSKAPAERGLECGCGAPVQRTATRCASCGRSFKEPLRTDALPRNWEEALASARKRLHELGLHPNPEDSFGGLAELHPQNAKQALGAPGILRDVGITLLSPEEFERRKALFADASSWPRKFPLGRGKDLREWVEHAMERAQDADRPTLERLVAEREDTLRALRDVEGTRPGWFTAAAAAGEQRVDLTTLGPRMNVLLAVAGKAPVGTEAWELRAVLRTAPERVPASRKRALLTRAEKEGLASSAKLGRWLDVLRLVERRSLADALSSLLQRAAKADGKKPTPEALGWLAQQVLAWKEDGRKLHLWPLPEEELERALKEVAKTGLPAGLARFREEKVAAPRGLEGHDAWAIEVHRVKTPKVRCPECGASIAPKAELRIPTLGKTLGARTVRIYECETCAREEPTSDKLQVRVEAGAPKGTHAPKHFVDYPDVHEARKLVKKGFDEKRYRLFLEQNGLLEPQAVKLGGYAGPYEDPEQLQLGVRCKHPSALLHLSPHALGLQLPKPRVAVELCMKPGCKRPGVAEEVSTG
ncbi:hypothetical protein [Cystobacter ferrugineus]|uniref:Uncharacterized protein n=1 Tax=Cystobacter ferrugineus TaxID=83449 RepID=A0A1L9AUS2_9BACT|nr:hypothetical protein [Cystobacter ferrugineus]OJH33760.1 hypothetical protein BON30_46940 [Cystobacter ferrugineus]